MLFKIIKTFFDECYCCVKSNGYPSDWFQIRQGTRQGQCSPIVQVFIDELLNKIDACNSSLKINSYSICACPTSADDMVILSKVEKGFDDLIYLCFKHSTRPRYFYITDKYKWSYLTKRNVDNVRRWLMGSSEIEEEVS